MIGTREISGSAATKFKNFLIDASESIIPSSMLMSITLAPPSTCCLATAKAPSKSPLRINFENLGEPVMLVRSPIMVNPIPNVYGSSPLSWYEPQVLAMAVAVDPTRPRPASRYGPGWCHNSHQQCSATQAPPIPSVGES